MSERLRFRRGTRSAVDAVTPADGEPLWVNDDKELRLGDGSTAGGIPIATQAYVDEAGEARRYVHEQPSPAAVWDIEHGLGFPPAVSVRTLLGMALNGFVEHVDSDHLTVTFAGPVSGTAYLHA